MIGRRNATEAYRVEAGRWRQAAAELDEEMQFHLECKAREMRENGVGADQARDAAQTCVWQYLSRPDVPNPQHRDRRCGCLEQHASLAAGASLDTPKPRAGNGR